MRPYKSIDLRFFDRARDLIAVCPFPGKHPLRLRWQVGTIYGWTHSYTGKLSGSAFANYERTLQAQPPGAMAEWLLFDKARIIARGVLCETWRVSFMPGAYRYLYGFWRKDGPPLLWSVRDFRTMRPYRIGTRYVYRRAGATTDPAYERAWTRYVDQKIPVVRNR